MKEGFEENIFCASERKNLKIKENDITKGFTNCVPHKQYYSDQVQEGLMGGACVRNGEEEKSIRDCGGETCRREFARRT